MKEMPQSKHVTVTQENTNLPDIILTNFVDRLERLRRLMPQSTNIDVCVDITGDHLYHFRAGISLNGYALFSVKTQHNEPFTAMDTLVHNIEQTFCEKVETWARRL